MRNSFVVLGAAVSITVGLPSAADAQAVSDTALVYEREVFSYGAAGRPDPFRSLLTDAELGVRPEDLTLLGIVYHPEPGRSVAVLAQRGAERRIRVRVGERIGSIRIAAIHQRSVDIVIEEFGLARRETLQISTAP